MRRWYGGDGMKNQKNVNGVSGRKTPVDFLWLCAFLGFFFTLFLTKIWKVVMVV